MGAWSAAGTRGSVATRTTNRIISAPNDNSASWSVRRQFVALFIPDTPAHIKEARVIPRAGCAAHRVQHRGSSAFFTVLPDH